MSRILGLYGLAYNRILSLPKSREGIIRFPSVFERLCKSFQIKKDEAWELLYILRDTGHIEIVAYQGVKIK